MDKFSFEVSYIALETNIVYTQTMALHTENMMYTFTIIDT